MQDLQLIHLLDHASQFVADKRLDVRTYLYDVYVKQVENDTHIVAADGHQLIKITLIGYEHDLPERVSAHSIKNAVKTGLISLIQDSGIDRNRPYPDYQRLIPTKDENKANSLPLLNVSYLSTMSSGYLKLCKKLSGDKHCALRFRSLGENEANVFEGSPIENVLIEYVIMPVRKVQ